MSASRVMISCVTFETCKISNPAKYYNTPEVHLIHYVEDPSTDEGKISKSFFDETSKQISKYFKGREDFSITEHSRDVNDFSVMLGTVTEIIDSVQSMNKEADIFVNLSAGSPEYISAATVGSMMYGENVHPFTVSTKEFTLPTERIKELYYTEDRKHPIGLTKSTCDPKAVMKVPMSLPNERLVRGLRILDELNGPSMKAKSRDVIARLKEKGLWIREEDPGLDPKTKAMRDTTYYHRDFMNVWISKGWVVKDEFTNRYRLTDAGKMTVATYYLHESGTAYMG